MIKNSKLVQCFALCFLAMTGFSAHAHQDKKSIQVRQECGFSYVECGPPLFNLIQDGGAASYQVDGHALFSLSYIGDNFVMTALKPNTVASDGGLPYGLDIYWGGVPLIQKWDCVPQSDPSCQGGTAIQFVTFMGFPEDPATPTIVHIPSVPEPESGLLALCGVGVFAWRWARDGRKTRRLHPRPLRAA